MKRFILRTLLFLTPIILISIIIISFFLNSFEKDIDQYKANNDVNYLFLGDSHVQQCVNDSLIVYSKNFAKDSESYYFTFYKLEKLLRNSANIKEVYLGFGYHNLSSYFDDYILGEYSTDVATRYFALMPFFEKMNLLQSNFSQLPKFFKQFIKNNIAKNYEGGYSNPYKNTVARKKSMDKRLKQQFYKNGKANGLSMKNIEYLNKIIDLCKEKKIKLCFLKTPLHPYYEKRIPLFFVKEYSKIVEDNNINVIDFKMVKFNDKSFIPDGDHLSSEGATQTSEYLNSLIEE